MLRRSMTDDATNDADARDVRARILDEASRLIAAGGIAALTTRAVAASVQAPTLYRLFGDKRGLLNAVTEHGLSAFFAQKTVLEPHPDRCRPCVRPDGYIAFGLAHPAVFAITNEVGAPASGSPAMFAGLAILRERVQLIACVGRLRVSTERAVGLIHAAGVGTVTTLLAESDDERDPQLSPLARDAVLAAIVDDGLDAREEPGLAPLVSLVVGLRAHLEASGAPGADGLTPGERLLLHDLLGRLSELGESE